MYIAPFKRESHPNRTEVSRPDHHLSGSPARKESPTNIMATTAAPQPQSMLHPRSTLLTPDVEPLPLYTRDPTPRDSDSISIVSAAPSYRSEAPPYVPPTLSTTRTEPTTPQRTGLPNHRYAPGFHARPYGSPGDVSLQNYNIANWSNVKGSHAARQYENVAKRRVERDTSISMLEQNLAALLPPLSPTTTISSTSSSSSSTSVPGTVDAIVEQPHSPLEDPQLVGEAAATRAREQRLYRERCLRGDEALRNENKGWDFMMVQMADWEERERSWMRFRESVKGPGWRSALARRIGVGKGKRKGKGKG